MNKKSIIFISAFILALIIGIICFIMFSNNNSIIYLDINPSIKLVVNKQKVVLEAEALNEDAESFINDELKGKKLGNVCEVIRDNIIERQYVKDGGVDIILYSEGDITNDEMHSLLVGLFSEKGYETHIIRINEISEEDIKLATEYNISPSKAAYINMMKKENDGLIIEDLIDKSVQSLMETKESGYYCDNGYTLEGKDCFKEISRVDAVKGEVCPSGSYAYNGNCYSFTDAIESNEYYCDGDAKLVGDKCILTIIQRAEIKEYTCTTGTPMSCKKALSDHADEFDDNCITCVDESTLELPTYACVFKKNGKCYHGPGKPYWEGKCINGDVEYNGKCYEEKKYEWKCSDGKLVKTKDTYCPSIKYTSSVPVYYCIDSKAKLDGDNCITEEEVMKQRKMNCNDGYTLVDNHICLDLNKKVDKEIGYKCEGEKTRLVDDKCITYEIVEAKHN